MEPQAALPLSSLIYAKFTFLLTKETVLIFCSFKLLYSFTMHTLHIDQIVEIKPFLSKNNR